ncbi:MAG: Gldg family protein [Aggregatilineales bacterium]
MASEGKSQRGLVLNRLSVARWGSAVGATALIVAAMALLAGGELSPVVVIAALIGMGGLSLWMTLAPEDFRSTLTGRRAVYGSNSLLIVLLFIGSVLIVYGMAARSGIAADFTSRGYYTLKANIRPIIQQLSRPIQITAFYSRRLLTNQALEAPILRLFSDAAPDKIRLVYADPDAQPILAGQFGLRSAYGIFVSYLDAEGAPDPNFTVKVLTARDRLPDLPVEEDYVNERWIAEAILQLEVRGRFRVLFSVGNGEVNLDNDATGIRDGLQAVGIQVATLDLSREGVPEGTTALIILAPVRDFSQEMADRVAAFLERGGKVLIMAEPAFRSDIRFLQAEDSPLAQYLWRAWGVRPNRDIVFDPLSFNETQYYVRAAQFLEGHPIVQKDQTGSAARPLFPIAQSWQLAAEPPSEVSLKSIYTTSPQAFGKLDLREVARNPDRAIREAADLPGPLALVVAAENQRTGARLLLVGDSDWVTNDLIVAFDGQILWTNMIDWLIGFLERVTVEPAFGQLPLSVPSRDLELTALITVGVLPASILLLGMWVWWRRARR